MQIVVLFILLLHVSTSSGLPMNLIQNHVKKYANFSVNPCDDFYAHVCPNGVPEVFRTGLAKLRDEVVENYTSVHADEYEKFSWNTASNHGEVFEKFLKSENFKDLCLNYSDIVSTIDHFLNPEANSSMNCTEKIAILKSNETSPMPLYYKARSQFVLTVNSSIAHMQLEENDKQVRVLFNKIRQAVEKAIEVTPWANKSVEMFKEVLTNVTFVTFSEAINATKTAMKTFEFQMRECTGKLNSTFDSLIVSAICDVLATDSAVQKLNEEIPYSLDSDKERVLGDALQLFNADDDRVYVGNDFLLLTNTDIQADLYGSIGFLLTHELMHTFVFDELDRSQGKPLVSLWTNQTNCVKEQSGKTCENFPIAECNSHKSFEEDAADLTAYRIVLDMYQKTYRRKTIVKDYDSLNNKQLFFYGAAVVLCDGKAMHTKTDKKHLRDPHSLSYHRVNSLMSQMDQFSEAFGCNSTDKMVMNKANHCELYGEGAPLTKKIYNGN